MPYNISGTLGSDLNNTITLADRSLVSGAKSPANKLGTQVWGDDGKLYVYAQANASIAASTAVATVNATTFLATATGGTYTSPPVAMVTGDQGWFGKASV